MFYVSSNTWNGTVSRSVWPGSSRSQCGFFDVASTWSAAGSRRVAEGWMAASQRARLWNADQAAGRGGLCPPATDDGELGGEGGEQRGGAVER